MDLRAAVRRWWDQTVHPTPTFITLGEHAICHTWRGDVIFPSSRDLVITPAIALYRHWEPSIEQLLERLLRLGMVAADAGAHVGYHTLTMARAIGAKDRVHAFEAHPQRRSGST